MIRLIGQAVKFHKLGRLQNHPWRIVGTVKGGHLRLQSGGLIIVVPLKWRPKFFDFNGQYSKTIHRRQAAEAGGGEDGD